MINILKKKDINVVDGQIIVTQETEQKLTRDDLIQTKLMLSRKKQQIIDQSVNLKAMYAENEAQIQEVDEMIASLPETTGELQEIK